MSFIFAVLAVFLYFLIRLAVIKSLPVFIDEATYAYWAELGKFNMYDRLISLTDGKQPLFIWITTFLNGYIANPVTAGRMVSLLSGLGTMFGLFLLGKEIFQNKWVGLFSMLIYALFPFAIIYNRMALYESLVAVFLILSLYLQILLVKYRRLDVAFALALILGGGFLTKTTGIFNAILIPASLIFFPFKKGAIFKNFLFWLALIFLALALSYLYYSVLFLTPDVFNIGYKNDVFSHRVSDMLSLKILPHVFSNIQTFSGWIISYTTFPFLLLVFLSFFIKKFLKQNLYLILCFLIPFFVFAALGKLTYPRYLFFITPPLILLCAESIVFYYRKLNIRLYVFILAAILFLTFSFYDFKILFDLPRAPLPKEELFQYANGWSAGYGMREIVKYLESQSLKNSVYVATDGNYNSPTGGLPTMMLKIYFMKNPNLEEHVVFPVPKKAPKELIEIAKAKPVYVIFNQTKVVPKWPMGLVLKFRKGTGDYFVRLYKIRSEDN